MRRGSLTREAYPAALERAIELCEQEGGTLDTMAQYSSPITTPTPKERPV